MWGDRLGAGPRCWPQTSNWALHCCITTSQVPLPRPSLYSQSQFCLYAFKPSPARPVGGKGSCLRVARYPPHTAAAFPHPCCSWAARHSRHATFRLHSLRQSPGAAGGGGVVDGMGFFLHRSYGEAREVARPSARYDGGAFSVTMSAARERSLRKL